MKKTVVVLLIGMLLVMSCKETEARRPISYATGTYKKAMIEKGLIIPENSKKMLYQDIGCIVLSLGIGLIVSTFFTTMDLSEDTTDLLVWGTILIFGSIGLLVAHWLRIRMK